MDVSRPEQESQSSLVEDLTPSQCREAVEECVDTLFSCLYSLSNHRKLCGEAIEKLEWRRRSLVESAEGGLNSFDKITFDEANKRLKEIAGFEEKVELALYDPVAGLNLAKGGDLSEEDRDDKVKAALVELGSLGDDAIRAIYSKLVARLFIWTVLTIIKMTRSWALFNVMITIRRIRAFAIFFMVSIQDQTQTSVKR